MEISMFRDAAQKGSLMKIVKEFQNFSCKSTFIHE